MKRNAIVRIVLYSLVAIMLIGILVQEIEIDFNFFQTSIGGIVEDNAQYDPAKVKKLEINWASGHVILKSGDTDQIIILQSTPEEKTEKIYCALSGDTLKIDYSKRIFHVGTLPEKDLIITVPQDWVCQELEIDGAALNIEIRGVEIQQIDLDGAELKFSMNGSLQNLTCDGANCNLYIISSYSPMEISIDGAMCALDLILPADTGFEVEANGWGCGVSSDLPFTSGDGVYYNGDRQCKIEANGVGCSLTILSAAHNPLPTEP